MTIVEDFAADYFVVQGITLHRQKAVRRALRRLEAHGGQPPEQLDDLAVRAWITSRVADGLHVNTVRRDLKCIKGFYKWCWQQRIIDADTYLRIKDVSPPRGSSDHGVPRPYKPKEVRRFWDELDAQWPLTKPSMVRRFTKGQSKYTRVWRHAIHLQTQAVASLALFAGLRSNEIFLADIDEIHPDNDYIVVSHAKSPFGQGNGHREVPFTMQGRQMIGDWLEFRALLNPPHDRPWLKLKPWANPKNPWGAGTPLDPIPEGSWEKILTDVGAWELHRFRHTCATEWLRAGVRIEKVSKLLGHASVVQTLCYAELVKDDVRADMHRAEQDFVSVVGRRFENLVN